MQLADITTGTYSHYREANCYLIAFVSHTIKAASSFIVKGDEIEWVPREGGTAQTAPLASVDRRFSGQINRVPE